MNSKIKKAFTHNSTSVLMDNKELKISSDESSENSNLETSDSCAEPLTENFQLSENLKKDGEMNKLKTQNKDEKELKTYQTSLETSIEEIHLIKLECLNVSLFLRFSYFILNNHLGQFFTKTNLLIMEDYRKINLKNSRPVSSKQQM